MSSLFSAEQMADIEALSELMLRPRRWPRGHFATAELEDESDPGSPVLIRDDAGHITAMMSQAAYEAAKAAG